MRRDRSRSTSRKAPPGAWLAFLAAFVQILLPFVVAYEIGIVGDPAYAATTTICIASSTSHDPGTSAAHRGLNDGCPLCAALAVGQTFTTPAVIVVPTPRGVAIVVPPDAPTVGASHWASSSYSSRAPPSIA